MRRDRNAERDGGGPTHRPVSSSRPDFPFYRFHWRWGAAVGISSGEIRKEE